jgi:hypothetical protein
MSIETFLPVVVALVAIGIVADLLLLRARRRLHNEGSSLHESLLHAVGRWFPVRNSDKITAMSTAAVPELQDQPRHEMQALATRQQIFLVEISDDALTTGQDAADVRISARVAVGSKLHITVSAERENGVVVVRHTTTIDAAAARTAPEIDAAATVGAAAKSRIQTWRLPDRFRAGSLTLARSNIFTPRMLFVGALVIYLCAVLIGVVNYPIFFFTDEAVHANFASSLWKNGLRDAQGQLLPTYFQIDSSFGLNGTSVYVHLLPMILFGKSVLVTRTTAALVTVIAAVAVSLLLRDGLKVKNWWLGALVLAASPAWFLHARTAFEYMLVASFFAATLYFYQRYRGGSNRALFACIASAALTFYSHGLGQVLIGATALVLMFSDLRYHLAPPRRKLMLFAAMFGLVLLLPWLRFQLDHQAGDVSIVAAQIRQRGSYWTNSDLTLTAKFSQWANEYLYGMSPQFWFLPNDRDLARHTIPGTGNLLLVTAPFALLGLVECLRRIRDSAHRNVLLALFIAPLPATIVAIGTPRTLWMIVPWAILITLGIERAIELITRFIPRLTRWMPATAYVALGAASLLLLARSLTTGQTWHTDYTLYGQQFGAQQVFGNTVAPTLENDPNSRFIVSPSWANGTDQFISYFIPPQQHPRVVMGQPVDWIDRRSSITANTYFVATRSEFEQITQNAMFSNITTRRVISYPDDTAGFYVFSLEFSPDAEARIAAEHVTRRTPVSRSFDFQGTPAEIRLSPLGEGRPEDLFDGKPETLVRGLEANPIYFDVTTSTAFKSQTFDINTGSMRDFTIELSVYPIGATEPITASKRFTDLPPDPKVTLELPRLASSQRFVLEIRDNSASENAQIHVREITLR